MRYQEFNLSTTGQPNVARDKVVLAYSGGLDTSVAVKWINETYGLDVIAYTCDLGQGQDIQAIGEIQLYDRVFSSRDFLPRFHTTSFRL